MTETIIIAGASALLGGLISFGLQMLKFKQEIKALQTEFKTDFMAESTAIHFLSHKGYTDRSFDTLRERLGGFEDDELRKILVRAGAIRVMKEGLEQKEWWRLLSRMDEFIDKKKS
jgi:hypothetical protein